MDNTTRAKGPIISFGPQDMEEIYTPHNYALVIQERVANYDVNRVCVDSGISANAIFHEAFGQMDTKGYRLDPIKIALFGFTGQTVYPKGEFMLPFTIGAEDLRKKVMKLFMVVNAPSSYNIILVGQP